MVDLHLVTWNRPAITELVIRTIARNTRPGTYKLHVYDNGSEKAMQQMLLAFKIEKLIDSLSFHKQNHGLEAAREQLRIFNTDNEFFVCIDNDCLPPQSFIDRGLELDWLEQLLILMKKYPDFAAISMRTQVMIGTGNIFEEADKVGDDIVEFPHPGGSFRIMRTAAVAAVGGWDEPKVGRGAEERFIGTRLNEVGYRTAFAVKVRCLHLFGLRAKTSERWGYAEGLAPEDTGHSDISHPALTNGDDIMEIANYSGEELAHAYRGYS